MQSCTFPPSQSAARPAPGGEAQTPQTKVSGVRLSSSWYAQRVVPTRGHHSTIFCVRQVLLPGECWTQSARKRITSCPATPGSTAPSPECRRPSWCSGRVLMPTACSWCGRASRGVGSMCSRSTSRAEPRYGTGQVGAVPTPSPCKPRDSASLPSHPAAPAPVPHGARPVPSATPALPLGGGHAAPFPALTYPAGVWCCL